MAYFAGVVTVLLWVKLTGNEARLAPSQAGKAPSHASAASSQTSAAPSQASAASSQPGVTPSQSAPATGDVPRARLRAPLLPPPSQKPKVFVSAFILAENCKYPKRLLRTHWDWVCRGGGGLCFCCLCWYACANCVVCVVCAILRVLFVLCLCYAACAGCAVLLVLAG